MADKVKLTKAQDAVLRECASSPMKRIGWPLSEWERVAKPVCDPMIDSGLLMFKRLGGYPGVQITPLGLSLIGGGE